jgi:preprotein translocase subunit SecE
MAVDVVRPGRTAGWGARVSAFVQGIPTAYRNVMSELRRVTWPNRDQVRQQAIAVILLSLAIGAVIALMDLVLQQVLVKWIPQLFSGR